MTKGPCQPPGFTCTKCGKCCEGFDNELCVVVFPGDTARISRFLEIDQQEFLRRYVDSQDFTDGENRIKKRTLKHQRGRCVFLSESNFCCIHEVKPTQCSRLPFGYFWNGERRFECMEGVDLPAGWKTDEWDDELMESYIDFEQKTER